MHFDNSHEHDLEQKDCISCGETKPAESSFYHSRKTEDGYDDHCKECRRSEPGRSKHKPDLEKMYGKYT